MSWPKGKRHSAEARALMAEARLRYHLGVDKSPVTCERCGRKYAGSRGLAIHVGKSHVNGVKA